jgi:hypothetical protein
VTSRMIRLALKLTIVAILLSVPSRASAAQECDPWQCFFAYSGSGGSYQECVAFGDCRTIYPPESCPECEAIPFCCYCWGDYDCSMVQG